MTDVKTIPQGTIIKPPKPGQSPLSLGIDGFTGGVGDYIDRRGLSNGTVEDALSATLQGAFRAADKMDRDGETGVIHTNDVAGVALSTIGNPIKGSKKEKLWDEIIAFRRTLPDQIEVPQNEHVEARVREAVKAHDKDGDGRISTPEAEALHKNLGNIIQSLSSAAVSPAADSDLREAVVVPTCITPGVETNCRK